MSGQTSQRQRRSDNGTANVVARGVNIVAVRDRNVARQYMEYKQVPSHVIARVLDMPAQRRPPSPEQAVSEALTPSPAAPAAPPPLDDE